MIDQLIVPDSWSERYTLFVKDSIKKMIESYSGITGVLICTDDGYVVVNGVDNQLLPKTLAAITASLVGLSESMAEASEQGHCIHVSVTNQLGHIIAVRIGSEHLLNVFAKKQDNLNEIIEISKSCALKLEVLFKTSSFK